MKKPTWAVPFSWPSGHSKRGSIAEFTFSSTVGTQQKVREPKSRKEELVAVDMRRWRRYSGPSVSLGSCN